MVIFACMQWSSLTIRSSPFQEVLHPFRPPKDDAMSSAYFQRVKEGKGNGFELEAADVEAGELPYLDELSAKLGMPHISFGCATTDGYFGAFGYGNALLSKYREGPFHLPHTNKKLPGLLRMPRPLETGCKNSRGNQLA